MMSESRNPALFDGEVDPRMNRLVRGELGRADLHQLERDAADDAVLGRQLEAFRPMSSERLRSIADMGVANLGPGSRTKKSSFSRSPWIVALGAVAVACFGFFLLWRPATPSYELTTSAGQGNSVGFDVPVTLTLAPNHSVDRTPFVEVWARRADASQPSRVALPVQRDPEGRLRMKGPAHRVTGGRFGSVELSFVLSHERRAPNAGFPKADDGDIITVIRTQVAIASPTYELAYLDGTGPRTRSATNPSAKATIELRPAVPVRGGLFAHLYAVDGEQVTPIESAVQPIGGQGVLRLTLPDDVPTADRWIVAVGPHKEAPAVEAVWSAGGLKTPPDGWWLSVVSRPSR